MQYNPKPADTENIVLSNDLKKLTEVLARNTHEVWAKRKLSEGWTDGLALDPDTRKHPSLIPYEKLSESEKDYDRSTSEQTIKLLIKLGYTITKTEASDHA